MPIVLKAYSVGSERFLALSEEVSSLLWEGTIELVEDMNSVGFYNWLFVVPKIVRKLEACSGRQHLKFLHPEDEIQDGDEPNHPVIHLQDAYFHIPIHLESRKYLGFMFKNRVLYSSFVLCASVFRGLPKSSPEFLLPSHSGSILWESTSPFT